MGIIMCFFVECIYNVHCTLYIYNTEYSILKLNIVYVERID